MRGSEVGGRFLRNTAEEAVARIGSKNYPIQLRLGNRANKCSLEFDKKRRKQPAGGVYPVLPATTVNTAVPPVAVTILMVWLVPVVAGQRGKLVPAQEAPAAAMISWAVPCDARGAVPVAPPVSDSAAGVSMQNSAAPTQLVGAFPRHAAGAPVVPVVCDVSSVRVTGLLVTV